VLDTLAGRETVSRADFVSLINDLHASWNASNAEMVMTFFADDAVVDSHHCPPAYLQLIQAKGKWEPLCKSTCPPLRLIQETTDEREAG
jgi:hypothetical protein